MMSQLLSLNIDVKYKNSLGMDKKEEKKGMDKFF